MGTTSRTITRSKTANAGAALVVGVVVSISAVTTTVTATPTTITPNRRAPASSSSRERTPPRTDLCRRAPSRRGDRMDLREEGDAHELRRKDAIRPARSE